VKTRRPLLPALAGLLLFALATGMQAQTEAGIQVPIPAAPQRWLTDEAGFLSPAAAAELDARLEAFERSSGHQVIVFIGRTTGLVPLDEWAVKAFAAWKIGRRGLDDGLVLFVMAEDRRLRIETGYGLEEQLPDALAGRIIRDEMEPRLQGGDNDGAVRAAVDRLIAVISGEGAASGGGEEPGAESRPMTLSEKILLGIGILFFLILFITKSLGWPFTLLLHHPVGRARGRTGWILRRRRQVGRRRRLRFVVGRRTWRS